jgi:hypothetical protein
VVPEKMKRLYVHAVQRFDRTIAPPKRTLMLHYADGSRQVPKDMDPGVPLDGRH